jgi:hypothetical protein
MLRKKEIFFTYESGRVCWECLRIETKVNRKRGKHEKHLLVPLRARTLSIAREGHLALSFSVRNPLFQNRYLTALIEFVISAPEEKTGQFDVERRVCNVRLAELPMST